MLSIALSLIHLHPFGYSKTPKAKKVRQVFGFNNVFTHSEALERKGQSSVLCTFHLVDLDLTVGGATNSHCFKCQDNTGLQLFVNQRVTMF